eukprot:902379_1
MSHYAFIVGSNGYTYSVANNCNFGTEVNKYNDESHKISSVAIGPDGYFALIGDHESTFYGPDKFMSKMREINSNAFNTIKHISFGCNDQWAITTKNGYCHYSLLKDGNCMKAVEGNMGHITYVSLSDYQNAWIVGYNKNDFQAGHMVSENITSFLEGIKICDKKIDLAEIGDAQQYFIKHEQG